MIAYLLQTERASDNTQLKLMPRIKELLYSRLFLLEVRITFVKPGLAITTHWTTSKSMCFSKAYNQIT